MAYWLITLLMGSAASSKHQTDSSTTQIVLYFLYVVQHIHFAVRYQPLTKPSQMDAYLTACGVQLLIFTCLIMTPSFALKLWAAPVGLIFSVGFWGVYIKD
jgi:hypothetical protein